MLRPENHVSEVQEIDYLLMQAIVADIHRSVPRYRHPGPVQPASDNPIERLAQAHSYATQVRDARVRGVSL